MRHHLLPAAVVLTLFATISLTTAPASRAGQASTTGLEGQVVARAPERCTTNQLSLRRIASAAGTENISLALSFINDSRHACSLRGWPVVTPLTAQGNRGSVRRVRNTFFGFKRTTTGAVILKPGEVNDAFVIAGIDNPVRSRTCGPSYRQMDATLPGHTGHLSASAFVPYLA